MRYGKFYHLLILSWFSLWLVASLAFLLGCEIEVKEVPQDQCPVREHYLDDWGNPKSRCYWH